jgi:hypothetical protein
MEMQYPLEERIGERMYSLGEVDFIQGMLDLGNPKNSVGLKPALALRCSWICRNLSFFNDHQ